MKPYSCHFAGIYGINAVDMRPYIVAKMLKTRITNVILIHIYGVNTDTTTRTHHCAYIEYIEYAKYSNLIAWKN
ncbi:hypothetical protein D5b_00243 [Faustovirus]|nr:hypothetical protein D5b_00243 [Faustovirus]AMN84671.1 hypothetical protein D6_00268 [Faustovirus]AMP44195.1 hypothetical protein PRJ_Dakar_00239 [Faustovirus]